EGRTDRGQRAERFPLFVGVEEHLEHHTVAMLMPGPLDRAVRQRRLGKVVLVGVLPPAGRQFARVENLDRPPVGHASATAIPFAHDSRPQDSTSFSSGPIGSFAVRGIGLRLSVTLLTVIPWPGAGDDAMPEGDAVPGGDTGPPRAAAGAAMAWAPAVGLLLGVIASA